MLVTDEKMAAHMQSLHISEIENEKMLSNMSCKGESMETDSLPKLILSDEIKNLKTDMIFPESVFKRLLVFPKNYYHLDFFFIRETISTF